MPRPRRRTVGLSLLAILVAVLVIGTAGFLWYARPQPLLPEAATAQASTPDVAYGEVDGRLEWAPADVSPLTGLVVYPGGKVPAAAYGPLAQDIAGDGYLVVIMEVPFNFAVFDITAADRAIAAHPEIEHWAVGGHSLGGAMAAQYTSDHVPPVEGLALWASYSATDLSAKPIAVVSVFGSLDAGRDRILSAVSKANLPPDTVYVESRAATTSRWAGTPGSPTTRRPRSPVRSSSASSPRRPSRCSRRWTTSDPSGARLRDRVWQEAGDEHGQRRQHRRGADGHRCAPGPGGGPGQETSRPWPPLP